MIAGDGGRAVLATGEKVGAGVPPPVAAVRVEFLAGVAAVDDVVPLGSSRLVGGREEKGGDDGGAVWEALKFLRRVTFPGKTTAAKRESPAVWSP